MLFEDILGEKSRLGKRRFFGLIQISEFVYFFNVTTKISACKIGITTVENLPISGHLGRKTTT